MQKISEHTHNHPTELTVLVAIVTVDIYLNHNGMYLEEQVMLILQNMLFWFYYVLSHFTVIICVLSDLSPLDSRIPENRAMSFSSTPKHMMSTVPGVLFLWQWPGWATPAPRGWQIKSQQGFGCQEDKNRR